MTWVDFRENGTNKLLARYDPNRAILEIVRRGIRTVFDLTQYDERQGAPDEQGGFFVMGEGGIAHYLKIRDRAPQSAEESDSERPEDHGN